MRLTLLAVVFFLALTLANALLLRNMANFVTAHDFAIFQISQSHAVTYEWDLFIWREIAAFAITAVVFTAIHYLVAHRTVKRMRAHDSFSSSLSNRR